LPCVLCQQHGPTQIVCSKRGILVVRHRRQPRPARHLPHRESVSHLSSSPGWLAICGTITHTLGRFAVKSVQEARGVDWQTRLASVTGSGDAYLLHRHTCLVAEDRSRLQVEPIAARALLRALRAGYRSAHGCRTVTMTRHTPGIEVSQVRRELQRRGRNAGACARWGPVCTHHRGAAMGCGGYQTPYAGTDEIMAVARRPR
jgi:hypothetical protein